MGRTSGPGSLLYSFANPPSSARLAGMSGSTLLSRRSVYFPPLYQIQESFELAVLNLVKLVFPALPRPI